MTAIATLLNPRSVAVVGASADRSKTSGKPIHFLRKHCFKGAILPVNPRAKEIDGLQCYPDVDALPDAPDVGLVLVGAERAIDVVAALAARGTKAAIVLASGFGESGAEGMARQAALLEAAGDMRLLGPNTIGLVNLNDAIPLSASGALDMDRFFVGPISFVSQSGGIVGSYLSRAAGRGIGLSKLISTSNEADLELADFIDHLADDNETRVIALYIEAIRNPLAFRRATAKALDRGKQIVAYKIGRSDAGARAALSHTGAMAGNDEVYNAFFRQIGIIRAETFSDLLDIPLALATTRRMQGSRVAVLTTTGGAGTLVSDNLGLAGFDTPPPDAATALKLSALQRGVPVSYDTNPIDLTLAGAHPEVLKGSIEALLESLSYDALVVVVGSSSVGKPELIVEALGTSVASSAKPVTAFVSPHAPEAASLVTAKGVPSYAEPEAVARVLSAMRHMATPHHRTPSATSVRTLATVDASGLLNEAASKALFARFGIAGARERIVQTSTEAGAAAREFNDRAVLKVLSSTITHKSEIGGVAVGVTSRDIAEHMSRMTEAVRAHTGETPQRFLVQEMVSGGVEVILGLKRDLLGTVLLLGAGGVATELYKDTALRLVGPDMPFDEQDANAMMRSLKSWPLLDGFRGRPKADVRALAAAIGSLADMALALGDRLIEAEINPLFVLPEGQGVRAADGVVILSAGDAIIATTQNNRGSGA